MEGPWRCFRPCPCYKVIRQVLRLTGYKAAILKTLVTALIKASRLPLQENIFKLPALRDSILFHFNMAANFPTSALEYELYERIKCEVLEDLRDWLVPKLRTDKIITYLRSKRVFDLDDQERISAQITTRRSNSMLLDFVIERGSTAFDQFCHAIRENCTGQAHVLEKILIEFERRKQEQSKP